MPGPFTSPVAIAIPFEPNRDPQWGGNAGPSGIQSINVQDAIEEAKAGALVADIVLVLTDYNGNANAGRYLEWFQASPSDVSPLYITIKTELRGATCQTTAANATCTLGVFDLNVSSVTPLYTVVMTAEKRVSYVGTVLSPLAIIQPNALLAIRVLTGSILTPQMQITLGTAP